MLFTNTFYSSIALAGAVSARILPRACPDYYDYATQPHGPYSTGKYKLSYQRPEPACRTITSQAVEKIITEMNSTIKDPDLKRLFENSCKLGKHSVWRIRTKLIAMNSPKYFRYCDQMAR